MGRTIASSRSSASSASASASATDSHVSAAPAVDRRRSARRAHVAEAWISSPTATSAAERVEVTSMNLSRHGIAFELAAPLPENTFYCIEIAMGEQRLVCEIRIVSCRKSDHGSWEVGAEFC